MNPIFLNIILVIVSFGVLVWGADSLIRGATSLAYRLGVPQFIIGITLVAIGTSLPELAVNVYSSIIGKGEVVMGNILGSNLANILLILGITAMISPLAFKKKTVSLEIPFLIFITALIFVFDYVPAFGRNVINVIEGVILLALFICFIAYNFKQIGKERMLEIGKYKVWASILFIILGIVLLSFGGEYLVQNAVSLATAFGITERVISVTIIAVGTSLPELVTSLLSVIRKNSDLAIGNIIGSNISNLLFIIGTSAVIRPVVSGTGVYFDILFNIAVVLLLFVFMFIGHRNVLQRWQGAFLVLCYIGYISYLVMG